jgi:prophage antirepressor-like protein/phage anti-repressor protein
MNLTGPEQGDEWVEVLVVYRDCDEPSVAPWVSAEELHAFLAVPQDFLSWAEIQIRRGPFIEGTDYTRVQRCGPTASGTLHRNRRWAPDFHLNLDLALTLAQNEATERGIQAFRYLADKRQEWLTGTTRSSSIPALQEALMNGDTQNIGPDQIVPEGARLDTRPSGTEPLVLPGQFSAMIPAIDTQGPGREITLDFGGHDLRIMMKDEEPWFVAAEVCAVLDIANHRDAVGKLDDDEKGAVGLTDAIGRQQENIIINESGLYTLIQRCRDAIRPGTTAHRFRKWVTREVLPAIHKQGRYETKPSHNTSPRDSVWLYDGVADDIVLKMPTLLSIEGGYIFLLSLSNGGVMLCASNKPVTYIQNVTHKLAEFNVTIDRIVSAKPHGYYLQLRNRILKRLADLPKVGQTFKGVDLEPLKSRMEPLLREALQTRAFSPTRESGAVKAELQALIGEASRLVETLKQAER